MESVTDVLFRVSRSKADGLDVYALFPGHVGTNEPHTCSCYQHIGQHCSADLKGCIKSSRPATPEEYADLKRELESAPYRYNLRVIKRATALHNAERRHQIPVPALLEAWNGADYRRNGIEPGSTR